MMKIINQIILCSLFLVFASCIGTVEESSSEKTDFVKPKVNTFNFQGIISARAISHDKIEIDFYPAGDATLYAHYLYVNESNTPAELKLETIPIVGGGVYRYTLKNLTIDTPYSLKLSAVNIKDGSESINENEVTDIRTFDNTTAGFRGISQVYPVPGSGSNQAIVKWNPANFDGLISAAATDVVYYEISYISEVGGYNNLNNPDYSGSDKLTIRVPGASDIGPNNHPTFKKMTGLLPDTTYYFQVRAVHKAWRDLQNQDPNNIPIEREQNSIYMKHTTDSVAAFVDFNRASLEVKNSPGQDAFTKVRLNWEDGVGNFVGYRIFVTEYTGVSVASDDQLTKVDLDPANGKVNLPCAPVPEEEGLVQVNLPTVVRDDSALIGCFNVPALVTNVEISNLNPYTNYHLKVALCRDADCSVQDGNANQALLGEIRFDFTEPVLAPFVGLNFLTHPQDPLNLNQVALIYDPPVTAVGYVDTLEVYCIDPNDFSNYVPFLENGLPISTGPDAGTISHCDNLYIETSSGGDLSAINSYSTIANESKLKVFGTKLQPDPDARYCFGITPAIVKRPDAPGPVRLDRSEWVVRCISPEVKVPTVEEFPGVEGLCSIDKDTFTIDWDEPTSGIFENYSVFYKLKNNFSFNFGDAIDGDAAYTEVSGLAATSFTATDLEPGFTYQVGVLTRVSGTGANYYSEPNLQVVDCDIPLPKASFVEWTRAFAIGPKVDGRVPTTQDSSDDSSWPRYSTADNSTTESRIYEAVSIEGIPYEVKLADANTFTSSAPGDTSIALVPSDAATFDGNTGNHGYAASNTGIISLAWKDVELEFLEQKFYDEQDAEAGVVRSARNFGYRIYRSSDYGLNWVNLTENRLIRAIDYSYYVNPSMPSTTDRMGFFTDYTVENLDPMQDIERARMYVYRIVPVYNDRELSYDDLSSSPHNEIKVTLPPPNMALVHRSMANRNLCSEIGKKDDIDHNQNYRCDYNGLGAASKGFPWQLDKGVIDVGGDMLVDRFALGCNITRGASTSGAPAAYKSGSSFFEIEPYAPGSGNSISSLREFEGFANNGNPFTGCTSSTHYDSAHSGNNVSDDNDPYGGVDPSYSDILYGDCIGSDYAYIPQSWTLPGGHGRPHRYYFPGAYNTRGGAQPYDHTQIDDEDPHFAEDSGGGLGVLGFDFRRNVVKAGEHGAIYYNMKSQGRAGGFSLYGPGFNSASSKEAVGSGVNGSCFINLASIGTDDKWRSRWFSAGTLGEVSFYNDTETDVDNHKTNLNLKTMGEISQSKALYDDWKANEGDKNFKTPPQSFWNKQRFNDEMPLARIYASNSAKLPKLEISFDQAQVICSTHRVQVGIKSETGSFSAFAAPKKKRLLRRSEFIAAAAFSESLDGATITTIESGTDDATQVNAHNVESCRNGAKPKGNYGSTIVGTPWKGDLNSNENLARILTGTGALDIGENTESCTSRYGIQDMVGNGYEYSPEELYCDYGSESMELYFGEYIAGIGSKAHSVPYPWRDFEGNGLDVGIKTDASIRFPGMLVDPDGAGNTWQEYDEDLDGNPDGMERFNNKLWKYVAADAGYCSIVDTDKDRVNNPYNFRNLSGVFKNLINPDGSLNTTLSPALPEATQDIPARDRMRNGDGFFLNFGEANLAPSLRNGGSLSRVANGGLYFNPIIGMPLNCENYGATQSCDFDSSDNKEITIEDFWENFPGGDAVTPPAGVDETSFFVGNSDFVTTGIADLTESLNPRTDTYEPPAGPGAWDYEFMSTIYSNETYDLFLSSDLGGPTAVSFYDSRWQIPRDTVQTMKNGSTGRYGLTINADSADSAGSAKTRCMVMINADN